MEFHLSTEVAWGLLPQVDGTTDETEDLDEFGDHFAGHPKTAGRTFTGGADFFLNFFTPLRRGVSAGGFIQTEYLGDFCEAGEGGEGEDLEIGKFRLGPIVGAQYTYAGIGGLTETGADSLQPPSGVKITFR